MDLSTKTTATLLVAGLASASAAQFDDLAITEVYSGISGPDGTEDWFEITNFGTSSVLVDGVFFDDDSASINGADLLPTFTLAAGESAVVLTNIGDNATEADFDAAIAEFQSIWNVPSVQVFAVSDGGFGGGGDEAYLIVDNGTEDGEIVTGVLFGSNGTLSTFDFVGASVAAPSLSVFGVNGAFESASFDNDNDAFGGGPTVSLIGSPGLVPTPASAALLGLGGLAAARRRR